MIIEGNVGGDSMDEDTHVYCTDCKKYKSYIADSLSKECKHCECRNCDCENPEDSVHFRIRKYYVEKSK